jgi:hypothetical protein
MRAFIPVWASCNLAVGPSPWQANPLASRVTTLLGIAGLLIALRGP